ncbi:heparinase II/III family protein [uncultured Fusobacterium sp.]|uniref:heparinase II/III domain-containing protein n=1 Tax=uncultured Fusobacterium sp. TaxID=159267 RepID=UPI00265DA398|nr:heparinase II/III family protein [uncultured Fusobacterium sp.]
MVEIKIEELLKNSDYKKMLNEMANEIEMLNENFNDSPELLSGWGHDYFCNEDGGALIYDINTPHVHRCPICGKEYTGIKYDQCWRYTYRYNLMASLPKAALLYRVTKDRKYISYIERILNFYKENYLKFKLQAKGKVVEDLTIDVGGASRIMPQGLNEAIMITKISFALELIKDEISQEWVEDLYNNFFKHVIDILDKQRVRIHNIALWIGAAIASVGALLNDKSIIDSVYNGEFGVKNQIKHGFTKDGFWYEGSIHYNYFALEGVVTFFMIAKLNNYEIDKETLDNILFILKAPYEYSFKNLRLPNPNDGWPDLGLKTYSYIYYMAYATYRDELKELLEIIEGNKDERTDVALSKTYYFENRIPLEKLVFGPEIEGKDIPDRRKSKLFSNSSFGMLRNNRVNVFMKYGHYTESHIHPDKMNLEVMIDEKYLTRDLSNPGYGSKMCNEWNRMTLSHNSVVIDGKNQNTVNAGKVEVFTDTQMKAVNEEAYSDNTKFIREINLLERGYEDNFTVETTNSKVKDWFFHLEEGIELKTSLTLEVADLGYNENGYQHLKEIKRVINSSERVELIWNFFGKELRSEINLEGKELFIGKSYDNPGNRYRTTLVLRGTKEVEKYKIRWEVEK